MKKVVAITLLLLCIASSNYITYTLAVRNVEAACKVAVYKNNAKLTDSANKAVAVANRNASSSYATYVTSTVQLDKTMLDIVSGAEHVDSQETCLLDTTTVSNINNAIEAANEP